MIRPLKNKVLLFPSPVMKQSPAGIVYPDAYTNTGLDNNRFWVAAIGPEVKDLVVGDQVICPMPAEDHARLEGGARVLEEKHVIAKLSNEY